MIFCEAVGNDSKVICAKGCCRIRLWSIDVAWASIPSIQMGLRVDLGSFGDIEGSGASPDGVGVI